MDIKDIAVDIRTQGVIGYDLNLFTERFRPATLDDLNRLDLLKRYDTKFIIPDFLLPLIISELTPDYQILEINGTNAFSYENQYYDTEGFDFYNQHHNGKLNRAKVRFRKYKETNTTYFEIKRRTNSKKTIKDRLEVALPDDKFTDNQEELIRTLLKMDPASLVPRLKVRYKRITLINSSIPEKVTIDTGLSYSGSGMEIFLPGLVLVEIKQRKVCYLTPVMQLLRSYSFHSSRGMSKYCLGMVLTKSGVKYNRFKAKIMILNKVMRSKDGYQFYN